MRKKTLLIGITSSILMVASLSAALINNRSFEVFAQGNTPNHYTAVIDSSNRLKATDQSDRYAFQLHGNDEYGCFYLASYWFEINPKGKYSDYIMSWTKPSDTNASYFQIFVCDRGEELPNLYEVDGKEYYLRGFPGAYKVTTVYSLSDPNLDVQLRGNVGGWQQTSRVVDGDLITEVTEKESGSSSSRFDWILWDTGTIYIKSIKIEYTCS